MKWMLIALVLGSHPVKTDLLFDSWLECQRAGWDARDARELEVAQLMNRVFAGAAASGQALSQDEMSEMAARIQADTKVELRLICIPHAG